jgi:hypothetical protein
MKSSALLITTLLLATTGLAAGQAPAPIQITVHTSTGDRQHSSPTLGQLPLSVEDAMKGAGVQYTVTWFPSVPGYAAMIIDGEPDKTTGKFESKFWWLCINGYSSAAGLQTSVKSGDVLEWSLVTKGKCAKDAGP